MRFDGYIQNDTTEFKDILSSLYGYNMDKVVLFLMTSWIKLRESLSNIQQEEFVLLINQEFGTNYKNIYYIPEKLEFMEQRTWLNKIILSPEVWPKIRNLSENKTLLGYALMFIELVSGGNNEI